MSSLWRPDVVGVVVAEREFLARDRSGRSTRVRVRIGQPVKGKGGTKRDPWWCPVEIKGGGLDSFRPVAGIDSLQALVLALELLTRILPLEADRVGLRITWLGDDERLVLARHALARGSEDAMLTLFGLLRDVAAILSPDMKSERQATEALSAIARVRPVKPRRSPRKPG
jgi:hypothetical protein